MNCVSNSPIDNAHAPDLSQGTQIDRGSFADLYLQFGATSSSITGTPIAQSAALKANVSGLTVSADGLSANAKAGKMIERSRVPAGFPDSGALIVVPVPIPLQPSIELQAISPDPVGNISCCDEGGLTNSPMPEIPSPEPLAIPNSIGPDLRLVDARLSQVEASPTDPDVRNAAPAHLSADTGRGHTDDTSSLDVDTAIEDTSQDLKPVTFSADIGCAGVNLPVAEPSYAGSKSSAFAITELSLPQAPNNLVEMSQCALPNSVSARAQYSAPDAAKDASESLLDAAVSSQLSLDLAGSGGAQHLAARTQAATVSGKALASQKIEMRTSDTCPPVPSKHVVWQGATPIEMNSAPSATRITEVFSSSQGLADPLRKSPGAVRSPSFEQSGAAVPAQSFAAAANLDARVSAEGAPPSSSLQPPDGVESSLQTANHPRPATKEAEDDLSSNVDDDAQSVAAAAAIVSNAATSGVQGLHPAAGSGPHISADAPATPRLDAQNWISSDGVRSPDLPQEPAVSPLHLAQMADRSTHAEMRIGFKSSVFGSVEVHTVIHANDVGVVIGSEKGDLRNLMTTELPGIANALRDNNLTLTQLNFQQSGFASANHMGGGGSESHPRYFQYGARSGSSELLGNSEGGTPSGEAQTLARSGLSIIA